MEELLGERPALIPDDRVYEPVAQAGRLLELAVEAPKSMKWKLRANVGEGGSAGTSYQKKSHIEASVLLDAAFPLVLHVAQSARWLRRVRGEGIGGPGASLLRHRHSRFGNLLAEVPQRDRLLQVATWSSRR